MYYKIMLNASKSFVKKSFWTRNSLCIISRPKLSTSIYNLVLITVCHFHQQKHCWSLHKIEPYQDTRVYILDDYHSANFSDNLSKERWLSYITPATLWKVNYKLDYKLKMASLHKVFKQFCLLSKPTFD